MSEATPRAFAASVIVPVGALDDVIGLQLHALAAQTLDAPWELVLATNAPGLSRDPRWPALLEVFDAARTRGSVEIVIHDAAGVRSASYARNVGAAIARADRLIFCDVDDVAEPGWLEALARALDDAEFVGGALDEATLAVPGQEAWRPPATPGALPSFLGHPYVVSANLGIRRPLFERLGGFDQTLIRGEDMALSFAAIDIGVTPVFVPDAVVAYRHRRGLRPLLRQHYLYGWGMSQIIARGGLPGGDRRGSLRPNAQPVARRSWVHVARRGAIAAGRFRGLVAERVGGPSASP